jgi:flagellar biosynthesis protein FlhG
MRPPLQDQAAGLRRLFTARTQQVLPLVANPFDTTVAAAVQRLVQAIAALHGQVLIIDVADGAPPARAGFALDVADAIEPLSPQLSYFSAAGLPQAWAQRHGHAAGLLDSLGQAAPQADVLLLHANVQDLPRLCRGREVTPVLLAADHPSSVQHAYAALKALAQRCGWRSFDLLLAAGSASPRTSAIVQTLNECAQRFAGGAELRETALFDDQSPLGGEAAGDWMRLVAAQMALHLPAPFVPAASQRPVLA